MFKKISLFIVCLAVVALIPVAASHNEYSACAAASISPSPISSMDVNITIQKGTAGILLKATGKTNSVQMSGTATLQKYSNGKWTDVEKWSTKTKNGKLVISKSKKLSKRGKYRVKGTVSALLGKNGETLTKYSRAATY